MEIDNSEKSYKISHYTRYIVLYSIEALYNYKNELFGEIIKGYYFIEKIETMNCKIK